MTKRFWIGCLTLTVLLGCGTAGASPTGTGATSGTGACLRDEPAGATFRGGANLGGYEGNLLPGTFKGLSSESQVTAAISRIRNTDDWNCFQKFYGGAVRKWTELTR
jgi:hypothetical protein